MNYIIKDGKYYRKGTLAHYLDKRSLSIGEPTASALPGTINPYQFVMENLLKNNCVVIKLKHSEVKYPSSLLSLVKEVVPAEQAILFYIDVDDIKTGLTLNSSMAVKASDSILIASGAPIYMDTDVRITRLEEACE